MDEDTVKKLKQSNLYARCARTFIIFFIISLIILLAGLVVFKAECFFHFILFRTASVLLKLLPVFSSYSASTGLFYLCIVIQVYLHFILLRMCVLSMVFLLGGFLRRFFIYYQFKAWLRCLIKDIEPLLEMSESSSVAYFKANFNKLKSFQKVFNQMALTNQSFQSKDNQFGSYLNEVMYFYQQFKSKSVIDPKQLSQFTSNAQRLIESLNVYLNYNQLEVLFKFPYAKVLAHLNGELLEDLKTRDAVSVSIAADFPVTLIHPSKESRDNSSKTLMVFCNQNAVCCELYHLSKDNFSFYMTLPNTSILLWNYQGFGLRKGMTTFDSIAYDTQRLANFIKAKFQSNTKVIIHGISIGGYAAVRLAKAMNDSKNVLIIADRTLGQIDLIVKSLPFGRALALFFNALFPRMVVDTGNVKQYISLKNKMILYDEKDQIIPSSANLITNVSYVYFNDILKKPLEKLLNKKIETIAAFPEAILSKREVVELKRELVSLLEKSNLSNLFKKTFLKNMSKCPLDTFLMNFFIFGFPFNVFKELSYNVEEMCQSYSLVPIHFQKIVNENKKELSELFIKFIREINALYVNLLLTCNDISGEQLRSFSYKAKQEFRLKETIKDNLIGYFGYTKRLFCGHNGKLTDRDNEYIQEYLEANGFIQAQNAHQIN